MPHTSGEPLRCAKFKGANKKSQKGCDRSTVVAAILQTKGLPMNGGKGVEGCTLAEI